ncbi:hypothetical protein FRB97_002252 [Tulasnella sp. 331]|nr:hypothetical protein FRB97_002252 [Tulasnella sp. 331]
MHTFAPPPSASLPNFHRLLVKGKYPPTAPLYLCLSDVEASQTSGGPLILCCGLQDVCTNVLTESNDDWLNAHGGTGRVAHNLSRIRMMYPPTFAHVQLILSLLQSKAGKGSDPRIALDPPPSLIVLVDPSTLIRAEASPTVSSFLLIVSEAVACLNSLNAREASRPLRLVIFDKGYDELEFAISPALHPNDEGEVKIEYEGTRPRHTCGDLAAGLLVHQYFDWVGTVAELYDDSTDKPRRLELTLQPNGTSNVGARLIYMWEMELGVENLVTGQSGVKTSFLRRQTSQSISHCKTAVQD